MRQYGIRIANVALFALCSFLTASVFNQIAAETLIPMRATTAQSIAPSLASAPTWSEREIVVQRNLFASKLGSSAAAPAPLPDEVDLEETKLPVKLLGTVAGADPALSTAAISDQESRAHQILKVGDFLEGRDDVRVAQIERMRVVLQNGLRLEELLLDEDAPRAPPPRARKRRNVRRRATAKPGERSRERRSSPKLEPRVKELENELSGGERTALAAQMAAIVDRKPDPDATRAKRDPKSSAVADIFSQARMMPKYENGEVAGLEFTSIEANSILELQGLRDGDVVTEVNGVPINSVSATSRVLTELTTVQDLNVKIEGPNGARTINVPAAEVANYLR